jgi:ribose transport system ATP-binding protein
MADVLAVRNLTKSFDGSVVLDGVSFGIAQGEVHGLLGENGSGKSTLIKILSGFHAADSGELIFGGRPVSLPLSPGQFRELGMSFVYQDLGLIDDLSVVENLRVSQMIARRGGLISWRRERQQALSALRRYGVEGIDPDARVGELTESQQALVAIVRSVSEIEASQSAAEGGIGLLVLDEPTVFLSREDTESLLSTVHRIVDEGIASVLLVSHDLAEIRSTTARVTVLRDGRLVGTVNTNETSEEQMIGMIIGRELGAMQPAAHAVGTEVAFTIDGLSTGVVTGFDLEIRRGEIVGLAGLAGSGFSDVPYALFGARPALAGRLIGGGEEVDLARLTPGKAMEKGIVLIPADRQTDGSAGELSVADNITLPVIGNYTRAGILSSNGMNAQADHLAAEFDIRPRNTAARYSELSGGNAQKAMLAKWLQMKPTLILLDEPTQGVDIGARAQIFDILTQSVAGVATSILCASTDYEQLATICDRILVFAEGQVVMELSHDAVTKERITEQVYNSVGRQWSEI